MYRHLFYSFIPLLTEKYVDQFLILYLRAIAHHTCNTTVIVSRADDTIINMTDYAWCWNNEINNN